MRKITQTAAAILLGSIVLSGCFGGFSPNANFYTLSADDRVEIIPVSQKKMSVQIQDVSIPDYLSQPQIVTLNKNKVEIKKNEFNRWGAPLGDIIQRTLAADISAMLPKANVKMAGEVYVPENYNVEINISRLDGTWNDTATLESWWQITDKNGNQLTSSRTYLTTPLGEENFVALVEAESALIAGLAQEISQSLSQLAK